MGSMGRQKYNMYAVLHGSFCNVESDVHYSCKPYACTASIFHLIQPLTSYNYLLSYCIPDVRIYQSSTSYNSLGVKHVLFNITLTSNTTLPRMQPDHMCTNHEEKPPGSYLEKSRQLPCITHTGFNHCSCKPYALHQSSTSYNSLGLSMCEVISPQGII
jgi:hypothetical protein